MDDDCLFCKIVAGTIPAERLHDDDLVVAIRDIAPRAPTHLLLLPRRHIESTGYLGSFPHLAGSVFAFEGTEGEARGMAEVASRHEDWSAQLERTELVPVLEEYAAR